MMYYSYKYNNIDIVLVKGTKVKVEYEPTKIKNLIIQCPNCGSWIRGVDSSADCEYNYQIRSAVFQCPLCHLRFSIGSEGTIEESNEFPEIYKKCIKKKIVWE